MAHNSTSSIVNDGGSFIPESEISPLTNAQEKILALLPIIPSLLSIFGSSMIIYLVHMQQKSTPYRRLLVGMSACDIFGSFAIPFWSFMLPRNTSQRIWAIGDDGTCTVLGWASQFSFSSILYNAMLSYYFLFTVRYGKKEYEIAKCIEPTMHVISIGYPLITATVGAVMGMYHETELGAGCWITDYPEGCGNDELIDGLEEPVPCQSVMFAYIFGGLVMVFLIVSLLINNGLIYCFVRNTILHSRRRYSYENATTTTATNTSIATSSINDKNNKKPKKDSQTRRIEAVATQAFLYVAACVVSYTPTLLLRILEGMSYDAQDEGALYPLLLLQAMCLPLQGLFNLLVFIRPKYMKIRKDHPYETRYWALTRSLYGDQVPPQHSTVTATAISLSARPGMTTFSSTQFSQTNVMGGNHGGGQSNRQISFSLFGNKNSMKKIQTENNDPNFEMTKFSQFRDEDNVPAK